MDSHRGGRASGRAGMATRATGSVARRSSALALVGSMLVLGPTSAGPPLVTDDPDVTPRHHVEISIPYELEVDIGGTQMYLPQIDASYGLTSELELSTAGGVMRARPAGGLPSVGMSDLAVGLKWRVAQSARHGVQVSVSSEVTFPSGDAALGLGQGGLGVDLSLMAGRQFGDTTVYLHLGYETFPTVALTNHFFAGLAVDQPVGSRLHLLGEVYGNQFNEPTERGGRGQLLWNVGAAYEFDDGDSALLFSIGRAFRGDPSTTVYIGPQITF